MASVQTVPEPDTDTNYKRTKSSVLKSFIHKRTLSRGTVLSSVVSGSQTTAPLLPLDHPHVRALGELQHNEQGQTFSSPKKSIDHVHQYTMERDAKSLPKKAKSTISLKSLTSRDTDKQTKTKDGSPGKPKKTKSSTNLAALLSRPRSTKNLKSTAVLGEVQSEKDKENRTPPGSPPLESYPPPPIYAQFSSERFTTQPLGGKFLEDEIDLYTPEEYSPSKQRNFYGVPGSQPTLRQNNGARRPMSTLLPSSYSIKDIHRQMSGNMRRSAEKPRRVSSETRNGFEGQNLDQKPKPDSTIAKRGARAIAAVAALGTKVKTLQLESTAVLDIEDVEFEFEAMLDRRNIPEHQRHKMRSLALSMKKDFIRQDWAETAVVQSGRLGTKESNEGPDDAWRRPGNEEVKARRPRSRTFTLSKSSREPSSPTKKPTSENALRVHTRTKSEDSTSSYGKTLTSTGAAVAGILIAKAKAQLPGDFVTYLGKVSKPELVEVGKLHKLRLLLRNETVAWTDEFIGLGGMKEIVGLLHRTLEVEWREEHEDALLHEVLLCLKALCTTALALEHLNDIQSTLFPALIHMLFDEEKKGPSEFTTRNIVTSLLFTYLKSAPLPERPQRAQVLLSYLRDPEPKEEERPVGFVLEMRRDRPYRVWCKEVINVTKEVFWIFLHNLNVIALPSSPHSLCYMTGNSKQEARADTSAESAAVPKTTTSHAFDTQHAYVIKFFPQELPPVPAAPYVGGVEWDATNYVASHLDLINGILSSLEMKDQRNALREQLRISGWERCMGATLRLCKEKFYGGVHAGLRNWVAAAFEDGWDVRDVRCGPPVEAKSPSRKSPAKQKKVEEVPRIEMPKLNFGLNNEEEKAGDVWI